MLWLGLHLPLLPLEVFSRSLPEALALAVCDRFVVLQANDAARAAGVHAGLKRSTALALAPALLLADRDSTREAETLRQIACWALQFTPSVSLQPAEPGHVRGGPAPAPCDGLGLLLEVEHSLRLFKGRDALLSLIRAGLAELGITTRIGCAPIATGAWLLARHRDGLAAEDNSQLDALLCALPVALLEQARPHLATLESIGARTLQDLLRLPRAGLARRFGAPLLTELDHAFGRQPQPRAWFEAPPRFQARLELLAQVEDAQALLFGARRLVVQLCGWLAARHAAVREVEITAAHDDLPATTLALRLADATRDADRITTLLRERLAATRLPAPVHTLLLRCDEAVPFAASDAQLFPAPDTAREELARLVERLQARLGRDQVRQLLLAADHRPEAAWRSQPVERHHYGTAAPRPQTPGTPSGRNGTLPLNAGALPRPLWLLASPIAISERSDRPYWNGPLALLAGPERIESGWWDGNLVQRDYFIASDESDMLLWIYRERVPDANARQGWFIQGRFG